MGAKVKRKNEDEIERREVEKSGSSWQNSLLILTFFIAILISIFFAVRQNQQIEPKSEKVSMDELMAKAEKKVEVEKKKCEKLRFWGVCLDDWHANPSLRTMNRVFKQMNYEFVNASLGDEWDILWAIEDFFPDSDEHDDPLFAGVGKKPFKIYQKINHFPGTEALVSKTYMNYLNQGSKYILPTFVMPKDFESFQKFVAKNLNKKFVEKNFYNRGVKIVDVKDVKKSSEQVFYQQFMDNHFLIDGHAFDFGIFVLITSFDPLRVYRFNSDVLIRFCAEKYHPFDPLIRNKYVVQGESKTVYEMPSFNETYKKYGFSSRIMFENLIEKKGFDVKSFWNRVDEAIVGITLNAEKDVLEELKKYNFDNNNFFELVRFDLVLDADLNPYVVEVNMSPNLTPAGKKYEENILIYEQLVHNTVKMIGGGSYHEYWARFDSSDILVSNKKNIAGDMKECLKFDCRGNCERTVCAFCGPCVTPQIRYQMKESFREHQHSSNFKRLFPSPIYFNNESLIESMTKNNRISLKWHKGMCATDDRWC